MFKLESEDKEKMIVYLEYGCIALFKNKTVIMFSLKNLS